MLEQIIKNMVGRLKSKKNMETLFILLFFIFVPYIFLGANIFSGEIVAPMDLPLQYSGWKESGISTSLINPERSDIVDALLPKWIYARNAILNEDLPLWNPTRSGGTPALTFLGNSFFSIGFLIFLILGGGIGFTFVLLARLTIAGLGTYKLCRTQMGVLPSIFGGVIYMMCGFNAGWLMWPHVETSMWIPWVLWAVIRVDDRPIGKNISILAIFVAALIFGGFMSVSAYGLFLTSGFAIWLIIIRFVKQNEPQISKRSVAIFSGVALGFLLSSIQLIPFLEWLGQFDTSWRHGGSDLLISNLNTLWEPFKYSFNINGHIVPHVGRSGYIGKVPIIFSVMSMLSILSLQKRKHLYSPLSPLFWIIATIITIIIAFNYSFLAQMIYKLPVFNNNLNSRFLVLIGLEFAILGAFGFQQILDKFDSIISASPNQNKFKNIVVIVLIFVIALHVIDMINFGQSQNTVVLDEMFYPYTPTINYVSNNIQSSQSVLATSDAFMLSGTLSAYGISEWFAHGYFKKSEKKVLSEIVDNAWKSPTAAGFNINQINMDSNFIDALGIRYILTSSMSPSHMFLSQLKNDKSAPPMPTNTLGQFFNLSEPAQISGISLLMATYGKQNSGTDVILRLFDVNNTLLASSRVHKKLITDNTWIYFDLDQDLMLKPNLYKFEVEAADNNTDQITIWSVVRNDNLENGYMIVNGIPVSGDLSFALMGHYQSNTNDWSANNVGNMITIYENVDCPPGAYVVKNEGFLEEPNSHFLRWDNVIQIHSSSNIQTFMVETNESGWFVKTTRMWPGWQASVNGNPAEIKAYQDILPAVHIEPGVSIIQFKYRPTSFLIGAIISLLSLFIIVLIAIHPVLIKNVLQKHIKILLNHIYNY